MTTNRQKVAAAISAISIDSPTTFSWFGEASNKLPNSVMKAIDAKTARNHLVKEIQSTLYRSFYGFGFPFANRDEQDAFGFGGNPQFVRKLSAANHGQGCWTAGWTVLSKSEDTVVVERHGLVFTASPEQVRESDSSVMVVTPKEQLGISPGHYLAQSDVDMQQEDPRVRVYWNITPDGASKLMSEITGRLNRLAIPFRFKVMNDPTRFVRNDLAVLYIRQSDFSRAAEALRQTIAFVSDWLKPGVPALTKRLHPGVGVAEDPESRESFGLHRCAILAEGIVSAHEAGCQSVEETLAVVVDKFADRGLSLEDSHLNPGSTDRYELNLECVSDRGDVDFTDRSIEAGDSSTACTEFANPAAQDDEDAVAPTEPIETTAMKIASVLAQSALQNGDRCTWLGPDLVANESAKTLQRRTTQR